MNDTPATPAVSPALLADVAPLGGTDPLGRMQIDVALDDFLALVRIIHTYRNAESAVIEAVFTFPIPYGAVLLGVDATLAGRSLRATALDKRAAETRYEDAIAVGDSAILVQEVSPGLHTVNLGNLAPGETAGIVFTYGLFLEWTGDSLTLRLPTTVAPRYGHPHMPAHTVPVAGLEVVRRAGLVVRARGRIAAMTAGSPTHDLVMTRTEDGLLITPRAETVTLDRDIHITFRAARFEPAAVIGRDGSRFVAAVAFQPRPQQRRDQAGRLVKIVIDCSGSMGGDSIAQAREAVMAVLRSLTPADRFAIVRFGTVIEDLTPGVVAATADHVAAALARAAALDADLGGTEMRPALLHTYALRDADPERDSDADVLLVTDGETWDDEGLVTAARVSGHRVFTIGVGAAAAEHLLRRMAEATGGACEVVTPRDGMAGRVLRQFDRMDAVRLEADIVWPPGATPLWPARQGGVVFAGDTVIAAAWFDAPPAGEVRFAVRDGEQTVARQVVTLAGPSSSAGADSAADGGTIDALARMVAAGVIAETANADQVTALAVRHGLLTPLTALVMVAERAVKLDGLPELRRVEHMLAAGWHGLGSLAVTAGGGSPPAFGRGAPAAEGCAPPDDGSGAVAPVFCRPPPPAPTAMPGGLRKKAARPPAAGLPGLLGRAARVLTGGGQDDGAPPAAPAAHPADRLAAALAPVLASGSGLSGVDFAWLERAGLPHALCLHLGAFRRGAIQEADLVVVLLSLLVAEPGGQRLPRDTARRIRQAFQAFRARVPADADAIVEAVRAVLKGHPAWGALAGAPGS